MGSAQTKVDVYINYNPPAGALGNVGEKLGAGSRFEHILQNDLNHFARMVDEAPPGALDPTSSDYLFHSESATVKGKTTERQNETMQQRRTEGDPRRSDDTLPRQSREQESDRSERFIPPQYTDGEFHSPPPQS
jgi:hypothetical protein